MYCVLTNIDRLWTDYGQGQNPCGSIMMCFCLSLFLFMVMNLSKLLCISYVLIMKYTNWIMYFIYWLWALWQLLMIMVWLWDQVMNGCEFCWRCYVWVMYWLWKINWIMYYMGIMDNYGQIMGIIDHYWRLWSAFQKNT